MEDDQDFYTKALGEKQKEGNIKHSEYHNVGIQNPDHPKLAERRKKGKDKNAILSNNSVKSELTPRTIECQVTNPNMQYDNGSWNYI